ncbi:MAG: hypothetical protein ACSLEN_06195 [Candidatus Malihini olakiniferum]
MSQWRSGCKAAIIHSIDIIIRTPIKWWRGWRKSRTILRELHRLNDAQLKNIGLISHYIDRFR